MDEIAELLQHIQVAQPFVYPMVCFAAYTGARRSEILRAKITDVDFDAKIVTIHEKKRVRGKLSTRRVPLASFLIAALKDWLAIHPGGPIKYIIDFLKIRCDALPKSIGQLSGQLQSYSSVRAFYFNFYKFCIDRFSICFIFSSNHCID